MKQKSTLMVIKNWALFLILVSFSMALGSIVAFVAMNFSSESQNAAFFFWQRKFIDSIMSFATQPGIWLVFIASCLLYVCERKRKYIALLIIAGMVLLIGQGLLIPLAHQVSDLAYQYKESAQVAAEFLSKKQTEDILGGINMLLLIIYASIAVFGRKE